MSLAPVRAASSVQRRTVAVVLAALVAVTAQAELPAVASGAPPSLTARAAVLIDAATGQRLFAVRPDTRLPIASTTKLMTALVTLEHVPLARTFVQNDYVPAAIDSQIGLSPGERMSVHDLLLALLLPSADDAAEDLAYNVGRHSLGRFIRMMNARAQQLGLTHTNYTTPIGLDTPDNYSSASDLVALARFLLAHERFFARAVASPRAVLHTGGHVRVVANRNDLVGRVPWVNGVKTGHTLDAGYVLVGSATRGGMTLLSAVLGSSSEAARDRDTLRLLNYGFSTFRLATPVLSGRLVARRLVRDQPGKHADLVAAATFRRVIARGVQLTTRVEAPRQLSGPRRRNATVGDVVILSDGQPIARIPLLLAHALPAVSTLTLVGRFLTRASTLVPLALLVGALIGMIAIRRMRAASTDASSLQEA